VQRAIWPRIRAAVNLCFSCLRSIKLVIYLHRLWRRLKHSDEKQVLIFDRSWYGRVMIAQRLVDFDIILAKFWSHLNKEEQLGCLIARQETPYKTWRLTERKEGKE
jgi:polyphosphate kinase 2 (PPK2 family)